MGAWDFDTLGLRTHLEVHGLSRVTILITNIRGLITPLITTLKP